mgnify:CR=1 FL=1
MLIAITGDLPVEYHYQTSITLLSPYQAVQVSWKFCHSLLFFIFPKRHRINIKCLHDQH